MIEKLQKLGESATSVKYPVVDAFARMCHQVTASGESEHARHDFACETLLRCLLEQNTDKFILSAAIASCAMNCSDSVLEKLWQQLLSSWVSEAEDEPQNRSGRVKDPMDQWSIVDPTQQAFELLEEERKTRLRGDHVAGSCLRLSSAFTRLALLDVKFRDEATVLSSSIMQQALELYFGHGSTSDSSALLLDRVRSLADNSDKEFAHLLKFLVNSTAKLSIKKTNWFSRHVLRFLLSNAHDIVARKKLLAVVVRRYMPLLLGTPGKEARQQSSSQASMIKSSAVDKLSEEDSSSAVTKKAKLQLEETSDQVSWDALEIVEKHNLAEIVEKLETLLEMLEGAHPEHSADFFETWTSTWSSKASHVSVPWAYVHAMVLVAVDEKAAEKYRVVLRSFQSLVRQTCRAHFRQMLTQHSTKRQDDSETVSKLTNSLYVLLSSANEFAQTLLPEIVDAIQLLRGSGASSSSFREASIFINAVMVCLGERKRVDVWKLSSTKKLSQKSAQETAVTAAPRSPHSEVDLRVLVSLLNLATLQNETGSFVRAQLSSRSTVRLLAGLVREVSINRYKMSKLLDLLDALISQRQEDKTNLLVKEWCRQHIVQQLIDSAYTVGVLTISDRLVGLMQSLSHRCAMRSSDGGDDGRRARDTLLWVTLRQCTKFCCGCTEEGDMRAHHPDDQYQRHVATSANFAELLKVMLCGASSSSSGLLLCSVGEFVEQELSSCHAKEGVRMNMFLLLLLQKMVRIERQPRSCISAVQLAVFSIGVTTRDQIRILQLQLLKSLCSRLMAIRNQRGTALSAVKDAGDCSAWEELVCNERLQSYLRRILNAEGVAVSSRTSIVLAQSVLKSVAEVSRIKQRDAVKDR